MLVHTNTKTKMKNMDCVYFLLLPNWAFQHGQSTGNKQTSLSSPNRPMRKKHLESMTQTPETTLVRCRSNSSSNVPTMLDISTVKRAASRARLTAQGYASSLNSGTRGKIHYVACSFFEGPKIGAQSPHAKTFDGPSALSGQSCPFCAQGRLGRDVSRSCSLLPPLLLYESCLAPYVPHQELLCSRQLSGPSYRKRVYRSCFSWFLSLALRYISADSHLAFLLFPPFFFPPFL